MILTGDLSERNSPSWFALPPNDDAFTRDFGILQELEVRAAENPPKRKNRRPVGLGYSSLHEIDRAIAGGAGKERNPTRWQDEIMATQTPLTFTVGRDSYAIERYSSGAGGKCPLVVILHGVDGLGGTSGAQIRKFAEQVADDGFLAFVPHYFDAGDESSTLPILQLFDQRISRVASYIPRIAAAVDFASKQRDADSGRLGLIGFSFGGGLVLDYAESAPAPTVKALVDFFGYIFDPRILANAGRLPPTLILHNANDGVVKVIYSSKPLLEALAKTKVVHESHFYDKDVNPVGPNHAFLPGGEADVDSRSRAIAWLKAHLKA